MSRQVSFKNRDRFIQLGLAIATLRKVRGLSQEKLAEKAGISKGGNSECTATSCADSTKRGYQVG